MSSQMRTSRSIKEDLPRLLRMRELSINKFARKLGVSAAHVARTMKQNHPDSFSGELAGRAAMFFDLPKDFFPEYRRDFLVDLIRTDAEMRDALYDLALSKLIERSAAPAAEGAAIGIA